MGISVLIVDDHPIVRGALRSAVETLADDVFVVVAGSLADSFRYLDGSRPPELVLLDLNLPDACGTATIGAFRRRAPGIRVIAVSGLSDASTAQACQAAGAAGFIPKSHTHDQMIQTMRRVLAGQPGFPASNTRPGSPGAPGSTGSPVTAEPGLPAGYESRADALRPLPPAQPIRLPPREYTDGRHLGLTDRQRGVLKLMLLGLPNKAICRELDLAEGTVKVHVSAVLRALGVATRAQVVVAAMRSGIRVEEMH